MHMAFQIGNISRTTSEALRGEPISYTKVRGIKYGDIVWVSPLLGKLLGDNQSLEVPSNLLYTLCRWGGWNWHSRALDHIARKLDYVESTKSENSVLDHPPSLPILDSEVSKPTLKVTVSGVEALTSESGLDTLSSNLSQMLSCITQILQTRRSVKDCILFFATNAHNWGTVGVAPPESMIGDEVFGFPYTDTLAVQSNKGGQVEVIGTAAAITDRHGVEYPHFWGREHVHVQVTVQVLQILSTGQAE
jgi:hypothetical protein